MMKWLRFDRLSGGRGASIGMRMALGFGVVCLLALMMLAVGLAAIVSLKEQTQSLIEREVRIASTVREWQGAVATNIALTIQTLSTRQPALRAAVQKRNTERGNGIDSMFRELKAAAVSERQKALLEQAVAHQAEFRRIRAELLLADPDLQNVSEEIERQLIPEVMKFLAVSGEMIRLYDERVATSTAAAQQRTSTIAIVVAALGAATIALAIAIGWRLTRAITRPLDQAVAFAEAVAQGDLSRRIDTDRGDEFGRLLRSLDRMQAQLHSVVAQVSRGVESVAVAAREVAQGNSDLSARTEQQASNLQQTAASMEQMTSTIRHSADNARQANQLAAAASDVATRGGKVVNQVVVTMGEIQSSSRKISEIISVIDGIAFQTNILALNAAVEAARAGEQGRGFAVVAGEVRSLAQRSAQAAREIKGLISDSVVKVEGGSRLVNEAGTTMTEIVGQVKRVTDLIAEITAATQEQSSGIGQVNQAVTQLDQMTQQNAALVEQSTAAAESLNEQAARLAEAVSVFTLSREDTAQVIAQARGTPKTSVVSVNAAT